MKRLGGSEADNDINISALTFSTEVRSGRAHLSLYERPPDRPGPQQRRRRGRRHVLRPGLRRVHAGHEGLPASGLLRDLLEPDFPRSYLKLDEKTLFSQVLGTDTNGTAISNRGVQTQTLNFSNAVYDVMVAVQDEKAGSNFGDVFGLKGTSMDQTTGIRDDALKTLSFDISSTPRTINGLSADFYRTVTQYQARQDHLPLERPVLLERPTLRRTERHPVRQLLHQRLQDRRPSRKVRTQRRDLQRKEPAGERVQDLYFAHVYNTLQIKNGMAGAMFA